MGLLVLVIRALDLDRFGIGMRRPTSIARHDYEQD